ncbi:MAG: hypothetical protein OEQ25_08410 [Gammaproteobacteria bacterium]|nr:hypothetical protein [Gammaproteobacteria bacterium]
MRLQLDISTKILRLAVLGLAGFGCATGLAQTYGPEPTQGAWWHRGEAQPEGPVDLGPVDLTGVWYGGPSGNLANATLPGEEMILTPYGYERYATVDHAEDPNSFCLPAGPGRMIMMAHPAMFVQHPGVTAVLSESQRTFRIIYTDGRDHPEDVDDYPEFMGSSLGHWEGDTFVVETVGIDQRSWLDTSGHEHSGKLKVIERFRLIENGSVLEHLQTYEDPVFFERPFTVRRVYDRQVGDRIMNHACNENEGDMEHALPLIGGLGIDDALTLKNVEEE